MPLYEVLIVTRIGEISAFASLMKSIASGVLQEKGIIYISFIRDCKKIL